MPRLNSPVQRRQSKRAGLYRSIFYAHVVLTLRKIQLRASEREPQSCSCVTRISGVPSNLVTAENAGSVSFPKREPLPGYRPATKTDGLEPRELLALFGDACANGEPSSLPCPRTELLVLKPQPNRPPQCWVRYVHTLLPARVSQIVGRLSDRSWSRGLFLMVRLARRTKNVENLVLNVLKPSRVCLGSEPVVQDGRH